MRRERGVGLVQLIITLAILGFVGVMLAKCMPSYLEFFSVKKMFAAMEHCGMAEKIGAQNVFREQPVRQTSTLLAIRHAAAILGDSCPRCGGTESGGSKQGGLYYVI